MERWVRVQVRVQVEDSSSLVRATSSAPNSLIKRSRSASLSVEGSFFVAIGATTAKDLDFPNIRA